MINDKILDSYFIIESIRSADGLDVDVREREQSRNTLRMLTQGITIREMPVTQ